MSDVLGLLAATKMALPASRKCVVDPMVIGPNHRRVPTRDARSGLGKMAIDGLRKKVLVALARMACHLRVVPKVIGRSLPDRSQALRCAAARTLK